MLWLTHQQLKSKSVRLRCQAVQKLRDGDPETVLPVLLKVLQQDPDPAVREVAAAALGGFRDKSSLDALISALTDPASEVRLAAVDALRRLGDSGAVPALLPLLNTPDRAFRARVAQALRLLGWHPSDDDTQALFLVALGELDRASTLGKAAVQPLSDMLKDPAYQRRVVAVNRLAEIGDLSAVGPLMTALRDLDPLVRTAAANAVGRLRAVQAAGNLHAMLHDRDSNVRSAAASALGWLGDSQALPHLTSTLKDPHWEVRAAAAEALGRLQDRTALDSICSLLSDPDREVRERAAEALGMLGDPDAVFPLLLAVVDPESVVRQSAARALQKVNPFWERSPLPDHVLQRLRHAARSPDYSIQHSATELLRRCGQSSAPGSPAPSATRLERRRRTALELFRELLEDTDPAIRQAAVEGLARLHDPGAAGWAQRMSADHDTAVRTAAELAIRIRPANPTTGQTPATP